MKSLNIVRKIPRNFLVLLLGVSLFGIVLAAPPSQVTGVKVELVGDNSVQLSWDEATSDEGVITGYKIYYGKKSVTKAGELYEDNIDVADARTSYPITDLEFGKTYYFAVTAVDDQLQESENYSEEASVEIPAKKDEPPVDNTQTENQDTSNNNELQTLPPDKPEQDVNQEDQQINDQNTKPSAPVQEMDIQPPLDATNLTVDKSNLKNRSTVTLRWKKSVDLDGDVVDQVFYVKKGNGDWDNGYSIGKDLEEMVFDVDKNTNYEVKIVTVDQAGNRSAGVSQTFSTETLATSGPGMFITLAIVAVIMFFFLSFRKRS